jgi:hypothetical protein
MAVLHATIEPFRLRKLCERIETDSMPNSRRSLRCLQWSIPQRTFLDKIPVIHFQSLPGNLLVVAFEVRLVELVVTAVSVTVSFHVHPVTLLVTGFAGFAPQELALVGPGAAETVIAEGLAVVADFCVHLVDVRRAVLALAGTVFRQVAFVVR